jgi:hypothetical protein
MVHLDYYCVDLRCIIGSALRAVVAPAKGQRQQNDEASEQKGVELFHCYFF